MIKKYRKKPTIVEVVQWTGKNISEVLRFGRGRIRHRKFADDELYIKTARRNMIIRIGDYIVKENGKLTLYKHDIFRKNFEEI